MEIPPEESRLDKHHRNPVLVEHIGRTADARGQESMQSRIPGQA